MSERNDPSFVVYLSADGKDAGGMDARALRVLAFSDTILAGSTRILDSVDFTPSS